MIGEDLVRITAEAAFDEPFRQIQPMTTYGFRKWLDTLGFSFHNWQTLHYLWKHGIILPVGVTGLAIEKTPEIDEGRFVSTVVHQGVQIYGDLGVRKVRLPALEWNYEDIPELSRSLWWHPLQLFQFIRLERKVERNWSLDTLLRDVGENYIYWERNLREKSRESLGIDVATDDNQEFRRILALNLQIEPIVHGAVHGSIRWGIGEEIEEYYEWRDGMLDKDLLQKVGLSEKQARKWHEKLAISANLRDPLRGLRTLVNQVSPDHLAKTKGVVLRTNILLRQAESLRRYLEWKFEIELPEEDDYLLKQEWVKQENYGTKRLLDGDRLARRRIVRKYGLDHDDRVVFYLEGPTEVAFVRDVAEAWGVDLENLGIELVDLEGKDRLGASRVLQQQLQNLNSREIFTYAALDNDGGGEHLRVLRNLAREGLLSAGFSVWTPDFEEQNFSLEELASVASDLAKDAGQDFTLTADAIRQRMSERQVPAGKAIEQLTSAQRTFTTKGKSWGAALAAMVTDEKTEVPVIVKDEQGDRPILTVLKMLIRGTTADFSLSLQHTKDKYSKGT
jgi:hypothetical protein